MASAGASRRGPGSDGVRSARIPSLGVVNPAHARRRRRPRPAYVAPDPGPEDRRQGNPGVTVLVADPPLPASNPVRERRPPVRDRSGPPSESTRPRWAGRMTGHVATKGELGSFGTRRRPRLGTQAAGIRTSGAACSAGACRIGPGGAPLLCRLPRRRVRVTGGRGRCPGVPPVVERGRPRGRSCVPRPDAARRRIRAGDRRHRR